MGVLAAARDAALAHLCEIPMYFEAIGRTTLGSQVASLAAQRDAILARLCEVCALVSHKVFLTSSLTSTIINAKNKLTDLCEN